MPLLSPSNCMLSPSGIVPSPQQEGRDFRAREWSKHDYVLQAFQNLVGSGDPIPSHDAMEIYLVFWFVFASVISGIID